MESWIRSRVEDSYPVRVIPFLGIDLRGLMEGRTGMELSKELKEKLENAKSTEEAKKILEDAGIILDDAELDQVAGGCPVAGGIPRPKPEPPQSHLA